MKKNSKTLKNLLIDYFKRLSEVLLCFITMNTYTTKTSIKNMSLYIVLNVYDTTLLTLKIVNVVEQYMKRNVV